MNDIEFIETTNYTNEGYITKQIPVINNRIISIDNARGGGGLMQLVAIPVHCYLTGNPEITFFEQGSKYLWNNSFYHSDRLFKIRSDDYSISNITDLTGEIKYNPLDISAVYSPYYDQYNSNGNGESNNILETFCKQLESEQMKSTVKSIFESDLITGDLYYGVINDAITAGKYQMVFTIYADLAHERRRHAVIAMNIRYY